MIIIDDDMGPHTEKAWRTLAMWTVYRHPKDYPDKYVARRFDVDAGGARPSASIIITPDLTTLRNILQFEMHLTNLPRNEGDDPVIVETWV
jgi:hypothetical protein